MTMASEVQAARFQFQPFVVQVQAELFQFQPMQPVQDSVRDAEHAAQIEREQLFVPSKVVYVSLIVRFPGALCIHVFV